MEHFEIDRTEEEREELVKQWIKDYWMLVVFAVGLAIAFIFGLKYYKQLKLNELNELAQKTQLVSEKLQSNDFTRAGALVGELKESNETSSFSAVASLELAKKLFDDKKYEEATVQYNWIIENAGDSALKDIARLRKARAQSNSKKIDEALATLEKVEGSNFIIEAHLLKGDILLADNQFDAAKKAYESIQSKQKGNDDLIKQRVELVTIKQQIQKAGEK